MADRNREKSPTASDNAEHKGRSTGISKVTITGGRDVSRRRTAVIPTENKLRRIEEKRQRNERKDAEWDRGIVRIKTGADRYFLMLILLLVAIGLITLFSASYPLSIYESTRNTGTPDGLAYIKRQAEFALIGLGVMFLISMVPYNFYRKWGFLFYGVVFILLVLAIFIGHGGTDSATDSGVRRWIGIKGTAFNVQPSELMKSALVMMLAKYYEKNRDEVIDYNQGRRSYRVGVLIPFGIIVVSVAPVLLGKHLSGTFIVTLIGVCIMFIGGAHFWKTVITGVIGAGAAGVAYVIKEPYALKRITTFFSADPDLLSDKWQTTQGLYALGSGGFLGKGFGNSTQKFSYVSDAHTDFIFTIWGEEMGFIGSVLLLGIFVLFVYRGFTIAKNAPDTFSSLLASGIIFKIGVQVLLNIAVVTDVFPNTGIPLPFFSYGGSAFIVLMAELGILLSISRHSYQQRM